MVNSVGFGLVFFFFFQVLLCVEFSALFYISNWIVEKVSAWPAASLYTRALSLRKVGIYGACE